MAKSFEQQANRIEQALDRFLKGAKHRSVICLIANKSEYCACTPVPEPEDKRLEQERLLMDALVSNREIFERFNRVLEPVQRYYRRQDRKQAKQAVK